MLPRHMVADTDAAMFTPPYLFSMIDAMIILLLLLSATCYADSARHYASLRFHAIAAS